MKRIYNVNLVFLSILIQVSSLFAVEPSRNLDAIIIEKEKNSSRKERLVKKANSIYKNQSFDGCTILPREYQVFEALNHKLDLLKAEFVTYSKNGIPTKVPSEALVKENTVVYRGIKKSDTKTICQILKNGMESPALYNSRDIEPEDQLPINTDLSSHSGQGSSSSILISTSYEKDVAKKFARPDGYVFEIKVPKTKGIDVNKVLGTAHGYAHEHEVSIPFFIPPENIISAFKVGSTDVSESEGSSGLLTSKSKICTNSK